MRFVSPLLIVAVLLLGFSHANSFFAEKKTIKEVMTAGHAGNASLLKKILGGGRRCGIVYWRCFVVQIATN